MTTAALDRSELGRWAASAALVLGLHAAAAAMLVTWQDPVTIGEPSDAVVIDFDLTPITTPPSDTVEELPPGPKQDEEAPAPPPKQEKVEEKVEKKVEVPPSPAPAVAALPPPEPVQPKPPEPTPVPPAPATTAPPRAHVSPAQIKSWQTEIATRIERNKQAYPRAAEARNQKGVVELAFSIDRTGHVVSATVLQSSGHPILDQEAVATVRRAEPYPAPPAGLDGETFAFKFPFKFDIH
jgi:protein TonB